MKINHSKVFNRMRTYFSVEDICLWNVMTVFPGIKIDGKVSLLPHIISSGDDENLFLV